SRRSSVRPELDDPIRRANLYGGSGERRALQAFGDRRSGVGVHGDDAVLRVDVHNARLEAARFRRLEPAIGDEDDEVTRVHEVGCGPVDADRPTARFARDRVRLEAGAVRYVDAAPRLAAKDIGGLEKDAMDGDGA